MTEIRATFHRDCVRSFEERRDARFSENTIGGVMAITDYRIVWPFEIYTCSTTSDIPQVCDAIPNAPCPVSLHVTKFTFKGSEGSPRFGRPARIEEHAAIKSMLKQLSPVIDSGDSLPSSPIQSQAEPHLDFGSPENSHDTQSQFMTQSPLSRVRRSGKVISVTDSRSLERLVQGAEESVVERTAALIDGLKSRNRSEPDKAGKEVREGRISRVTISPSNIETVYTQIPQARHIVQKQKEIIGDPSPTDPERSADSEKENSQESVQARKGKVEAGSLTGAKQLEKQGLSLDFTDEDIFTGLTRIPRRDVKVSKEQQKLLGRDDAWFHQQNDPLYARIPPKDLQCLIFYRTNLAQKRVELSDMDDEEISDDEREGTEDGPVASQSQRNALPQDFPSRLNMESKAAESQALDEEQESEEDPVSWPSSPVMGAQPQHTDRPQSSTSSDSSAIDGPEVKSIVTHIPSPSGEASESSHESIHIEATDLSTEANPELPPIRGSDQYVYQRQRLQHKPIVFPTSSPGLEEELEIDPPCAVDDPVEDDDVSMEDAPEISQATQAPLCGQEFPSTDCGNPGLVQVERTPFGRAMPSSTVLTSSELVIPGTFDHKTFNQPKRHFSAAGGLSPKRKLSVVKDDCSERPVKRNKRSTNIESLNFTQEREPQDIKGLVNEQRRQFEKSVRAENKDDQKVEQNETDIVGLPKEVVQSTDQNLKGTKHADLVQSSRSPSQTANQSMTAPTQQTADPSETDEIPADESSYYEMFQASYPDYTGSRNSFLKVLVYIEWLLLVGRPPPRFVWDDFVRAFGEYGEHLRSRRAADQALMTYIQYYSLEVIEPLYVKRIITPHNLQDAIAMDEVKAEEYRQQFHRTSKAVKLQRADGSEDLRASTQSQTAIGATICPEGTEPTNVPESTAEPLVINDTSEAQHTQPPSDRVATQSELRKSISAESSPSGPDAMEIDDPVPEAPMQALASSKKPFFETTSQVAKVAESHSIPHQSDFHDHLTPRRDSVVGTPKTKSYRRLPWAATEPASDVKDDTPQPSSKERPVKSNHELLKSTTTPQKLSAVQSFSSPILGNIDDSPIPASLKIPDQQTRDISISPSQIRFQETTEVLHSVVTKSKSKSSRSSPGDVEKVEEWLEAQSESAPPSEDRSELTPDSRRLSLVEIRKKVRESLASSGKKEAAVPDVVQYYVPKRPRKSGRYSVMSTPDGEGMRRDSGKNFQLSVEIGT